MKSKQTSAKNIKQPHPSKAKAKSHSPSKQVKSESTQMPENSLSGVKKAFLIGLGATVMTAEKLKDAVKDLVDDMVQQGHINPSEAKQVAEDLKKRFQEGKNDFEDGVRKAVDVARQKTAATIEKIESFTRQTLAPEKPATKKGNKVKTVKAKSATKAKSSASKSADPKKAVKKVIKKTLVAKGTTVTKSTALKSSDKKVVASTSDAKKAPVKKVAPKPNNSKTLKANAKKAPVAKKVVKPAASA